MSRGSIYEKNNFYLWKSKQTAEIYFKPYFEGVPLVELGSYFTWLNLFVPRFSWDPLGYSGHIDVNIKYILAICLLFIYDENGSWGQFWTNFFLLWADDLAQCHSNLMAPIIGPICPYFCTYCVNFAFCWNISLSANLLFLKSIL